MPYKKTNLFFIVCNFISAPLFANTTVEASAKLRHFNYEEYDLSGQTLNKEIGIIPGLAITLSKPLNNFTNSVNFELYNGQVDYLGQTQLGVPHTTNTIETQYFLSYKLNWSPDNNQNALYGQIYWQQWDRDILPNNGVDGLFERYKWWRLEAGLQTSIFKKEDQTLSLALGIFKTSNGTIQINLNEYGYGMPILDLGNELGINSALNYKINFEQNGNLQFSIDYINWAFGRSNSQTVTNGISTIPIIEPRSDSQMTTATISYIYNF